MKVLFRTVFITKLKDTFLKRMCQKVCLRFVIINNTPTFWSIYVKTHPHFAKNIGHKCVDVLCIITNLKHTFWPICFKKSLFEVSNKHGSE